MTFIVLLIALLVERFFDWSHLRHWFWYPSFERLIMKRLPNVPSYGILAAAIIPLILILMLFTHLLNGALYGFPMLVFQVFVLLYCFGPQNLWADAFASINALVQSDAQIASDKLKATFGISPSGDKQTLHRQLIDQIFIQSNRRVFAVVFWYSLLGLGGALLYRLVSLSATPQNMAEDNLPELRQSGCIVESVLDWIPARLFTFLFALGGHFSKVLMCWPKKAVLGLSGNESLLGECGAAALGDDQGLLPDDGSMERNALSLLDRVFIIVLVLAAIGVFVF